MDSVSCNQVLYLLRFYNDIDVNIDTVHKATVDELIEHFKGKENHHD